MGCLNLDGRHDMTHFEQVLELNEDVDHLTLGKHLDEKGMKRILENGMQ